MALDAASDLTFADTLNNAVRRVNYVNGMIATVAGAGDSERHRPRQ